MKLGLVGRGISYSLSRKIHQASAERLGFSLEYNIYDLRADQLDEFIKAFDRGGGQGFNVTTPYKTFFAEKLKSPLHAVNTVYKQEGIWQAASTDGIGFARALERDGRPLRGFQTIVFLGSGGVVLSLLEYIQQQSESPVDLFILRRNPSQDQVLQTAAGHQKVTLMPFTPETLKALLEKNAGQALLVQATCAPQHGDDLGRFTAALSKVQPYFFELNYGTATSALYGYYVQRKLPCQDGRTMLIEQAMASQQIWWGKHAYPCDQATEKDFW